MSVVEGTKILFWRKFVMKFVTKIKEYSVYAAYKRYLHGFDSRYPLKIQRLWAINKSGKNPVKSRIFATFLLFLYALMMLVTFKGFEFFCHKICHEICHDKMALLNLSEASCCACFVWSECRYTLFMTWSELHPPIFKISASGTPRALIFEAK